MAKPQARLGDKTSHGGVIITGAKRTLVNGRPVARMGDKHNCPIPGHGTTPIVSGSPDTLTEGKPNARVRGRHGLRRPHRDGEPRHPCQLNRSLPKSCAC